jgi:hypothetical protein
MHEIEIFICLLYLALVLKAGHFNLKELWSKIFGSQPKYSLRHFDNIILKYSAALFTSCQLVSQSYVPQILTYENLLEFSKNFRIYFEQCGHQQVLVVVGEETALFALMLSC